MTFCNKGTHLIQPEKELWNELSRVPNILLSSIPVNCAALDEHKTSACLKYHMTQAITEKKKKKKIKPTMPLLRFLSIKQNACGGFSFYRNTITLHYKMLLEKSLRWNHRADPEFSLLTRPTFSYWHAYNPHCCF